MADEKPDKKRDDPPALTREQLVSYFQNVGAKDRCPICDYTGWYVFTRGEENVVKLDYEVENSFLPAIVMVCRNCNFVRLHLKRLIEDDYSSGAKRKPDASS